MDIEIKLHGDAGEPKMQAVLMALTGAKVAPPTAEPVPEAEPQESTESPQPQRRRGRPPKAETSAAPAIDASGSLSGTTAVLGVDPGLTATTAASPSDLENALNAEEGNGADREVTKDEVAAAMRRFLDAKKGEGTAAGSSAMIALFEKHANGARSLGQIDPSYYPFVLAELEAAIG